MIIYCFDVFSHSQMHLPFNESYLRILRAAFPDDQIKFFADSGHIINLKKKFIADSWVNFSAIDMIKEKFGFSRHNPFFSRIGSNQTLDTISQLIKSTEIRFLVFMGVDAGLYSAIASRWTYPTAPKIHLLMHAQLGDSMVWRSRNPFIKNSDFVSQLKKPLSNNIKIVALELGVDESITMIAPHLSKNILTIEHPIDVSEFADATTSNQPIRIGFLGNANRNKGFDVFADIAKNNKNSNIEFHAVGIKSKSDGAAVDTSGLVREPVSGGLSRLDYLAGVRQLDIVCSPLYTRCYDFIASGTVSDAITALKPIIGLKSRTLQAIHQKYGAYGEIFDNPSDIESLFNDLDYSFFENLKKTWVTNLINIRKNRMPFELAKKYRYDCDF